MISDLKLVFESLLKIRTSFSACVISRHTLTHPALTQNKERNLQLFTDFSNENDPMNKKLNGSCFIRKLHIQTQINQNCDTIWNRIPGHDWPLPNHRETTERHYMQCTSLFYTESSNYPLQSGSVITSVNGERGSQDKSPVNLFSIIIIIKVRSRRQIKMKLHPSFTSSLRGRGL
ncbi:uncharacterized protein CDAR_316651 [Caerostris darwini]|uniref:Uncharacterized protein n=1 Tax=Caerostris darwini TaxID=1538125 RepID=A0AAV4UJC2_9ARAC|nr:uncharacterized protein CDAR_316651 [Caerostris darwini]